MTEIKPLDIDDAWTLLKNWSASVGRTLSVTERIDQISVIGNVIEKERLPLFLRVVFEQARRWKSWEMPKPLPETLEGNVRGILAHLEKPNQHGKILVERTLVGIASARHGLTEDEVIGVLSADNEVMEYFYSQSPTERLKNQEDRVKELPVVIWSRLYADLKPYIDLRPAGDVIVLGLYHRQFKEVVVEHYLDSDKRVTADAHRRLAVYFQHQACPHIKREWHRSPLRSLSELPYQRLREGRIRQIEHLLCDPGFVAECLGRGLLDQMIGDLGFASDTLALPNVGSLRNAVQASIAALRLRPDLSLQIITNRLRNEELDKIVRVRLDKAEFFLDKTRPWLCSQTRFGNKVTVRGVISVSPQRGVFYVYAEKPYVEECDMETHRLLARHFISNSHHLLGISVHADTGHVAWIDTTGVVHPGIDAVDFHLRARASCFGYLGRGMIGVDQQNALVSFDPVHSVTASIATSIDETFAAIGLTPDNKAAVLISGDKLPDQRILILSARKAGMPEIIESFSLASPATAACLNESGSSLLTATRDRKLGIYDVGSILPRLNPREEVSYRDADGTAVRGYVQYCRLTVYQSREYAILATNEGELAVWDVASGVIRLRGSYRGLREYADLRAIEALPEKGRFVVATEKQMELLFLSGEDSFRLRTPLTNCSLSKDGVFVAISDVSRSVTWYKDGRRIYDYVKPGYEPTAIAAAYDSDGAVFVGYRRGSVVKLHPGKEPEMEDAVDLFDRAVVSVVALDSDRVLASSETGQAIVVSFQPVKTLASFKPVGPIRKEQFVRPLGKEGSFVSCGRYYFGGSKTSIVVVSSAGTHESVLETSEIVQDLDASEDGSMICVAFSNKLRCYKRKDFRWVMYSERPGNIVRIAANVGGVLAVVLRDDSGLSWLELWSTAKNLETIAAMELPMECASMCSYADTVAIGAVDGRHCVVRVRM